MTCECACAQAADVCVQARQLLEHAEVPGLRLLEPEEWEGSTKVTQTLTPTPTLTQTLTLALTPTPTPTLNPTLTLTLTTDPRKPNPSEGRRAGGAPSCAARGRALCRKQVGSAFGHSPEAGLELLSAPEHASGRPQAPAVLDRSAAWAASLPAGHIGPVFEIGRAAFRR